MAKDDKEAKKAQQVAEKAAKKAAKKEAKKNKKKGDNSDGDDEEEGGSNIIVILVSIVIIIIWLGIFALLVKLDVGGFGSTILRPILKDVPYVNRILPEDNSATASGDAYAYSSLSEAIERIKALETELSSANASKEELQTQISALQTEVSRLSVYEQQQAEFEELKEKFYQEVVFSEEAPDINEYQTWYESIDSENAAELYKQVIQQEQTDEEVQDYAATYSTMDPDNAAKLMEEMKDNLDLVAKILKNMSTEKRAAIMDEMDSAFAATLTALMEPK